MVVPTPESFTSGRKEKGRAEQTDSKSAGLAQSYVCTKQESISSFLRMVKASDYNALERHQGQERRRKLAFSSHATTLRHCLKDENQEELPKHTQSQNSPTKVEASLMLNYQ